ncbi:MAG TPA: vanadium-dependent haloperoxidase [Gaiellaceae bacterium]|nr:vanadium-dependent haloperoxidase [Gaiellaceae bacterium]
MNARKHVALVACALAALAAPGLARADAVTDWTVNATNTILGTTPAPTAHGSTIPFAMVQGAVYDAVNAIDRRYRPYLVAPPANPWDSKDAAAATAAYRVLATLYPGQQQTLKGLYDASLAGIQDVPAGSKAGGIAAGNAAADAMLAARENDGRNDPFTFEIGNDPGDWRPLVSPTTGLPILDPDAWVANVQPFLLKRPSQLRSKGPNELGSRAYAKDFDEVKSVGSLTSTTRTPDQTMAAVFWQAQPIALYGGVLRSLSARYGLGTADNARLFAMTSLAAADGAISCWNDKYHWYFWRPMAAIREAATDGNPRTVADPSWTPLFDPSTGPGLTTPPFPDHPSGHGCVSGSILTTARSFFGTDKVAFDVFSSRFPGQPRHFERFSQALQEVVDARVWGGIHFRTADVQGANIGKKVARWLRKHYFQQAR